MIAIAVGPLVEPDDLSFCPRRRAARCGAVAHPKRGIGVTNAIAEGGRDLPHGAPDFQAAVRLAQRNGFLDRLAPCADIFEPHGARVAVAEDRLDVLPATEPIF